LPQAEQRAVGDAVNEVLVSDASAWEVGKKVRIGKLPGAVLVAERFGRGD
jgi:PIN domain nuclease of toxin-antitoxin system